MIRALFRFQVLFTFSVFSTLSAIAQQVTIVSPPSGTIVTPGQSLSIVASVSSGPVAGVLVVGQDLGVSSGQTLPPYSVTLSIPPDVVGVKSLTAFAIIGPDQAVTSSPVSIDVEPSLDVTLLSPSISSIQFGYVGDQYPLSILGTMSDNSVLDLAGSTRMVYSSSNNGVASVGPTGLVTATGAGTALITATYGTQTVSVAVMVPTFITGDLDGDGLVTPDDMAVLETFLGQNASGPSDARDLNGDGTINLADLQKLQSLCGSACAGAGLPLFVTTVGTGTVSSNLPGITCPTVCTGNFSLGASVILTASPSANFAGWSGACTGLGSCSITMDSVQSVTATFSAITDTTPPVTSAAALPGANANGWNNASVTVTLTSTDNESGGTGVKQVAYSASGAQAIASTIVNGAWASFTISAEGVTTVTFFATDNAGNVEAAKTIPVKIDQTAPTISGMRTPGPDGAGWNNGNVSVSFACADALSGLAVGSPPAATVLSAEGANQSVNGSCSDVAGNTVSATVSAINIDKTPPILTATVNPPPNAIGWENANPTVSWAAVDALSGVSVVSAPVTVVREGAGQIVNGSAADLAGNLTTGSVTINLDKTPPEAFNQFDPVNKDVVLFGRDSLSGVAPGPVAPSSVVPIAVDRDGDDLGVPDADDVRKELRTYKVFDLAGNSIQIIEKVRRNSHHISVKILSLQYGHGALIKLAPNHQSFEWHIGNDGALRRLEQEFQAGPGREAQRVNAEFEARENQTEIRQTEPEPKIKTTKQGLDLLRMATSAGKLSIEF